ncbi:hypothetical protein Strain138_001768 [Pseudogemmatithrix spongiicola]|uniref:Uncharacterized protein n=1 Tax=Pseudogemmatithrix spongiicola TaxID=3062599 RepID=A0AA49JUR2_9BACT|nr:hypothetical protein Strain138_001768 [Gemmatimonadaceae bacterium 'strain 138']WKW15382.1 hypothetical protein Strain318_001767 [Gemmatimonadaceae bacterium 'strain 318']
MMPLPRVSPRAWLPMGGVLLLVLGMGAMENPLWAIAAPMTATIVGYVAFVRQLHRRVGDGLVGDLAFVYLGFLVLYTVVPGVVVFYGLSSDIAGALEQLLPSAAETGRQLWRQVLFGAMFAVAYLAARGTAQLPTVAVADPGWRRPRTILVAGALVFACLFALIAFSAPVESYYEHYTRYDHLGWTTRKFVSLSLRLSFGLYCALLTFLYLDARRWSRFIPFVVLALAAFEIGYSRGARIQGLIVLLMAMVLHHLTRRRITMRQLAVAGGLAVAAFTAIELVRLLTDVSDARDRLLEGGLGPPAEFLAVFLPSLHLYAERAAGTLPAAPWPMFFFDFIALFTWGDFTKYMPMYWYAETYFPFLDVPPFTIGPVAESALWGGEWDIAVRGLLNGLFFAWIVRAFLRFRDRWWALGVYAYCYATCALALKYSIFVNVQLVEKNLVPAFLLVEGTRMLMRRRLPRLA